MHRGSYRAGVDAGVGWAYTALVVAFAITWTVVGLSSRDVVEAPLWVSIAALVIVAVLTWGRAMRRALGDRETVAVTVAAVALQVAWAANPAVPATPGQRCMVTTAVVFVGLAFASRRTAIVTIGIAITAQLLADVVVTTPIEALTGLAPVAAAGLAAGACVPVLRSAAGRADAASEDHRSALEDAAELTARQRANTDFYGLLHDEVTSALRAATTPAVTVAELRQLAREAMAAIDRLPGLDETPAPRDLGELVRDVTAVSRTVTTVQVADELLIPGDVARAATAALAELLRNVSRHARASRVQVVLDRDGDGFVLTVADDGVGFRPTAALSRSHGLRYSVIRRLADVGGTARVHSAPGKGTVVELGWHSTAASRPQAPTRTERIATAVGDVRRPLAAVVLPYLAISTAFAIKYGVEVGVPLWLPLWLAGLVAITIALLGTANSGLSRGVSIATLGFGLAGSIIYLLTAQPVALDDYSSWPVGALTPLLALIAVVRPSWESGTALALQQSTIMLAVMTGHFGDGPWNARIAAVTPTALSTVTPVLLGLVISQTILRLGGAVARANAERSAQAAEAASRRARDAVHARRLADLNKEILPFLRGIADGSINPESPAVRDTASELEQATRDELHLPGVLDATTRSLIRRARAAGCNLTIQSGAPVTAPEVLRALLNAALNAGHTPSELILSLHPTPSGATISLTTVPGDESRTRAILDSLGPEVTALESTPEATWAEMELAESSQPAGPVNTNGDRRRNPRLRALRVWQGGVPNVEDRSAGAVDG